MIIFMCIFSFGIKFLVIILVTFWTILQTNDFHCALPSWSNQKNYSIYFCVNIYGIYKKFCRHIWSPWANLTHSFFNTWLNVSTSLSYLTVCGLVYFLMSTFSRHLLVYLYLTAYVSTNIFLRHLVLNTITTSVSLWFVVRLKINLVFYLKFPFTFSDSSSEYRSHILTHRVWY
jgi:hypothetical protein